MGGSERPGGVRRHFLVPNEFVNGLSGVLVTVASQRSVVFAMKGELAVIRGGLAWSCEYPSLQRKTLSQVVHSEGHILAP
jgi:hypothetical protein